MPGSKVTVANTTHFNVSACLLDPPTMHSVRLAYCCLLWVALTCSRGHNAVTATSVRCHQLPGANADSEGRQHEQAASRAARIRRSGATGAQTPGTGVRA